MVNIPIVNGHAQIGIGRSPAPRPHADELLPFQGSVQRADGAGQLGAVVHAGQRVVAFWAHEQDIIHLTDEALGDDKPRFEDHFFLRDIRGNGHFFCLHQVALRAALQQGQVEHGPA